VGRTLSICALALLAAAAVACAKEADEDTGAAVDGKTAEDYADALALSNSHNDNNSFSLEVNGCIAGGYVDAIGVEELRDHVTPAEIRDDPEAGHKEWGIEISRSQAEDIYEVMQDCADVPAALSTTLVGLFGLGSSAGATECLVQSADEELVHEFAVGTIIDGDDYEASDELAGSLYDWMAACIDLRAVFLSQLQGASPDQVACIDSHLTDDLLKRIVVASFTGGESPLDELQAIDEACETGGGATTTTIET